MTNLHHDDARVGKSDESEGAAHEARRRHGCGCQVTINIESDGDVIINYCTGSQGETHPQPVDCFTPQGAWLTRPAATGNRACQSGSAEAIR